MKHLTRDQEAAIRERAAAGLSRRAIALEFGVSHTTIGKVLAAAPPAPLPQHMAPPPPAAPVTASDAPALVVVRELLAEARAGFANATACSNSIEAQRYARTAAGLTPVLARLERDERDDADMLHLSRADVSNAMATVRERVAAIVARGELRCADCSRALSVEWGTGPREAL
jgi:hypothetical protein